MQIDTRCVNALINCHMQVLCKRLEDGLLHDHIDEDHAELETALLLIQESLDSMGDDIDYHRRDFVEHKETVNDKLKEIAIILLNLAEVESDMSIDGDLTVSGDIYANNGYIQNMQSTSYKTLGVVPVAPPP
jgi:hypothetical protein